MERIGRILFFTIGVGCLVFAATLAVYKYRFIRSAETAEGVVVSVIAMGTHQSVVFTTASGERVEFLQQGIVLGYKPGQKVRVLYAKDNAESTASVDAIGGLWFDPFFFLFIGVGFVVLHFWGEPRY